MRVNRLVDKAEPTRSPHQLLYTVDNLIVVIRRHGLHDDAHWPRHARSQVRSACGIEDRPEAKVWIGAGENEFTGALIDLVGIGFEAQVRDAQQRGDVGIVLWAAVSWVTCQACLVVLGKQSGLTMKLWEPKPSTSYA